MNKSKIIFKVSLTTIIINILLTIIKLLCGILGKSKALISDAIHSLSDVLSTLIVIVGAKISSKSSDKLHPYGHERFECVFSSIMAISLFMTALFIGYSGLDSIINHKFFAMPTFITVIGALSSIVIKELMYWYTIKYAKVINSISLKADAHHHRGDSLSSIGSLIGVLGARLGFPICDSIASIIICLFIIKIAIQIFLESMNQMVDKACDEKTINKYKADIKKVTGVISIDVLKTRQFGSKVYIDIEISVKATLSLIEAHNIAEEVHDTLEQKYPEIKHIMVHVNPYIKQ